MKDKKIKISTLPMQGMTEKEKSEVISGFTKLTGVHCIALFKSLGLETGFECEVMDFKTKQVYQLSFKRITK
jgi:hypothetical protein